MESYLYGDDVPEAFCEPAKKRYTDAKVSMLERSLKSLLLKRTQLLNNSNNDLKALEDVEISIRCTEMELEAAKYEAIRLCA